MINKLIANIKKTGAPIVVGLDPMLNYIPKQIQENAYKEFGETLEGAAEAIWQFNKGIVDATYDLIPAVKPQIAMYEQFGLPGLAAYKRTIDYCKEKNIWACSQTAFTKGLTQMGLKHTRSRCTGEDMIVRKNPVSAFQGIKLRP